MLFYCLFLYPIFYFIENMWGDFLWGYLKVQMKEEKLFLRQLMNKEDGFVNILGH